MAPSGALFFGEPRMKKINKFRISHNTVAKIIELRDQGTSWEAIELITGHDAGTCRSHYFLNKDNPGNVFYFTEFLEKIKKLSTIESMNMRAAYNMAVGMGYEGSLTSFRGRPDVRRLPLKGSTVLKQKRISMVFTKAKLNPNKSLRDLVWEVFHDYTYSGKYQVLNELSEISYD